MTADTALCIVLGIIGAIYALALLAIYVVWRYGGE